MGEKLEEKKRMEKQQWKAKNRKARQGKRDEVQHNRTQLMKKERTSQRNDKILRDNFTVLATATKFPHRINPETGFLFYR